MMALALLAGVPVLMWVVQSVMLKLHGMPLRWRLSNEDVPDAIRKTGRITTQLGLLSVILVFPLVIGSDIATHYGSLLPRDHTMRLAALGAATAILILTLLFIIWLEYGCVAVDIHGNPRKRMRRLLMLVPSSLLGAFAEEFVFRGVIQFDLQRSTTMPTMAVVMLSALLFAAAHYVRKVKRYWTFPGHLALGVLLCVAYAATGSLWLPLGIHAGGIFVTLGVRPYLRYRGPAWVTGASIFPFAGIPGIAGLLGLAAIIAWKAQTF